MIKQSKQIWNNLYTDKCGNVVTFLMEHEQFNYPEALGWLAKKYTIEIEEEGERTEEQKEELKLRESLFIVSQFAKKLFVDQLHTSEGGKNIGLTYFKDRGYTLETIKKFELGYSPQQRNAFTTFAENKGYGKSILEASGLSIYRENRSEE